jgi:hypothetical protein
MHGGVGHKDRLNQFTRGGFLITIFIQNMAIPHNPSFLSNNTHTPENAQAKPFDRHG